MWRRAVAVAAAAALASTTAVGLATAAPVDSSAHQAEIRAADWHVSATLGRSPAGVGISCASSSACLAIENGQLLDTADAGRSWTVVTDALPAEVARLTAVSCWAGEECLLTASLDDETPAVVRWQPETVTLLASPSTGPLPALTCPDPQECMATDGIWAYVTDDAGATWSSYRLPRWLTYGTPAVGCAAGMSSCVIAGEESGPGAFIETSSDGGQTWSEQRAPHGAGFLNAISCPSQGTCYAGGGKPGGDAIVIASSDGGTTWSQQKVPPEDNRVDSLTCATAESCWVAGTTRVGSLFVLMTDDGGQSWSRQQPGGRIFTLTPAIDCPDIHTCVAVREGQTWSSLDGGRTWATRRVIEAPPAPYSMSCPTKDHCVGVGTAGADQPIAEVGERDRWSAHLLPANVPEMRAVACPSVSRCVAVGTGTARKPAALVSRVLVSADGGVHWESAGLDDHRGVLDSLACPAVDTCLATGYRLKGPGQGSMLVISTDSGRTWTHVPLPSKVAGFGPIACPSVMTCVVIGRGSAGTPVAWITHDLGDTFHAHPLPDAMGYPGLACSASTCVAVGFRADDAVAAASQDDGVTWAEAQLPASPRLLSLVACASATRCVATAEADSGGPLVLGSTDGGATWQAHAVPRGASNLLHALACATRGCFAAEDGVGYRAQILTGPI